MFPNIIRLQDVAYVAELLQDSCLEIKGKINCQKLLIEKSYAAYLIFKTTPESYGLDTFQEASVSVGNLQWKKVVCIKPSGARSPYKCVGSPGNLSNGWIKLELGQFFCDSSTGEVVIIFKGTDDHNEKSGLIVAGIEVRPI